MVAIPPSFLSVSLFSNFPIQPLLALLALLGAGACLEVDTTCVLEPLLKLTLSPP